MQITEAWLQSFVERQQVGPFKAADLLKKLTHLKLENKQVQRIDGLPSSVPSADAPGRRLVQVGTIEADEPVGWVHLDGLPSPTHVVPVLLRDLALVSTVIATAATTASSRNLFGAKSTTTSPALARGSRSKLACISPWELVVTAEASISARRRKLIVAVERHEQLRATLESSFDGPRPVSVAAKLAAWYIDPGTSSSGSSSTPVSTSGGSGGGGETPIGSPPQGSLSGGIDEDGWASSCELTASFHWQRMKQLQHARGNTITVHRCPRHPRLDTWMLLAALQERHARGCTLGLAQFLAASVCKTRAMQQHYMLRKMGPQQPLGALPPPPTVFQAALPAASVVLNVLRSMPIAVISCAPPPTGSATDGAGMALRALRQLVSCELQQPRHQQAVARYDRKRSKQVEAFASFLMDMMAGEPKHGGKESSGESARDGSARQEQPPTKKKDGEEKEEAPEEQLLESKVSVDERLERMGDDEREGWQGILDYWKPRPPPAAAPETAASSSYSASPVADALAAGRQMP